MRFRKFIFIYFINIAILNLFWMQTSSAVQIPHKFALVKIEPDKSITSPSDELSVIVGLDSISTPSFNTAYDRCVVRPFVESDFINDSGVYESDYTPNLRFSFDVVIDFMQNNQVISGPYFLSIAMLHNGSIIEGKQNGYDMQLYSVERLFNNEPIYSKPLEKEGTRPLIIKGRSANSYPISFAIPGTGDVYAQYYFTVSQFQTFDMSTEAKKNQNYKCGGITNAQDLYFSGRQVLVLSNSSKQTQLVSSFNVPRSSAINLQALKLKAVSSSGSPIQFNSLTPSICLTNNDVLIFRGLGKCKVEAIAIESSKFLKSPSLIKEIQIVAKGAKYEIICAKGNNLKSVIATKPKCPAGYLEI